MSDEVQPVIENPSAEAVEAPAAAVVTEAVKEAEALKPAEAPKAEPAKAAAPKEATQPKPQGGGPRPERGDKPRGDNRGGGGNRPGGDRGPADRGAGGRSDRPGGDRPGGDRGERREGGRPNFGGGRPFDGPVDIELEKLISDSLYLDNQAHVVVMRMRDMDSGTKSQLRRLYNAVRRAVRAPESERQHQFVMLRARLAYTIARHSLRSLDALERLLLQVTRKNDARGYERFKDLFEAIVAYNE
jgi:CRISPR type III-A-associated protein Csm2